MLVVGDWLFNLEILKDGFSFLEDQFQISYTHACIGECKEYDLIVGWGSGCLDLLSSLDRLRTKVLVMMSPYLDFDRFFSWCYKDSDWKDKCLEKSLVSKANYFNFDADWSDFKGRKIFLKEASDRKNVYLFVSGEDNLIKIEDVLKMEFFFKNSSIHLIEGAGFAPFEQVPETFKAIFNGFVINENF